MKQIIKANCYVLRDNIDTDQIYPGKYLELTDHEMIAKHVLEGVDPELPRKIKKGGYTRMWQELWMWFWQGACGDYIKN